MTPGPDCSPPSRLRAGMAGQSQKALDRLKSSLPSTAQLALPFPWQIGIVSAVPAEPGGWPYSLPAVLKHILLQPLHSLLYQAFRQGQIHPMAQGPWKGRPSCHMTPTSQPALSSSSRVFPCSAHHSVQSRKSIYVPWGFDSFTPGKCSRI